MPCQCAVCNKAHRQVLLTSSLVSALAVYTSIRMLDNRGGTLQHLHWMCLSWFPSLLDRTSLLACLSTIHKDRWSPKCLSFSTSLMRHWDTTCGISLSSAGSLCSSCPHSYNRRLCNHSLLLHGFFFHSTPSSPATSLLRDKLHLPLASQSWLWSLLPFSSVFVVTKQT